MQTAFLVDLDNTLFNTEKIRPLIERGITGQRLNKYFKKFLFPESLKVLEELKKLGKVIIFSTGKDLDYQKNKLRESGIEKVVGINNILIFEDKHLHIEEVIQKLKKEYQQIFVIDDRVSVLEKSYEVDPNVLGILIRHGKYKNIPITNPNAITYQTTSIKNVLDFVTTYVNSLADYYIKKGLNEKQINQLIKYSNTDHDIKNYTSDPERFKNRKKFNDWIKKGKYIYVLSDNEENLCGIIWFGKEKFASFKKNPYYKPSKYPYTFAIRTYANTRGKGLARQFMEICFRDFGKKGIWLTASKENTAAVKLYSNFGFKKIPDENPYNKIVMIYG